MEKVAQGGAGRAGLGPRPVFASLLPKALGHSGAREQGRAQAIRIVTFRYKHSVPCQHGKKTREAAFFMGERPNKQI